MSKRKMRRCFFFCYLKLNYFEFEWRENCSRQFFDVASWRRRVDPIFSIRHMWPNVSFLTRKQPCTACSSRRINYVWKEEASNFQCTNTLFALSFVFVLLLLLFVLRGLSTLLHFLAFVIPGENQCFLFPHILRFFFWHAQFLIVVCSFTNALARFRNSLVSFL